MGRWLRCKIAQGMFSDELTVIVRTLSGENISVFVPKHSADQSGGKVRVRVAERNERAFAVLPDENQSVIEVAASDLMPA